ncbi:MFS transporter [Nesterenkonia sp. E16_7]|uniref:MFS transporter n=1 Tax=unclassified Nesterenkonia TaxID=2629769 RepID=UPI001A912304|nr:MULTISPECIES: MFS transporter [unclassified Nesterenkonia]MBO0594547.1 MFS transporter [Nesterenkonia sp. E16_10]MBO0597245.1 MFS transporter [Nesterenkonia sp. E16_7]
MTHGGAQQRTLTQHTEAKRAEVQRRTLTVVVFSQILGGAGLAAGVTVGALLAQEMLGSASLAGLPIALFTLGSALAAFSVGRVSQRWGRRIGLGLGFTAGGLGAIGVVAAAIADHVPLLFFALFIYGAGTATNLQARYAGTDLAPESRRATAISIAMVSTTLGAVAGPNLVQPLGDLATSLGIPPLAGPFLLAAAAYLAAAAILLAFLRPDPFLLARELAEIEAAELAESAAAVGMAGEPTANTHIDAAGDAAGGAAAAEPVSELSAGARSPVSAHPTAAPRPEPGVYIGATVMVLTQIAMVAIMTMTPIHMLAHGHGLGSVGLVIGLHVGAMWLPSLVTGVLVDRFGRIPMSVVAAVLLLGAGVVGAGAPGDSLGLLILALILLGVGWNVGLIAGTALVVDATVPENRARTQGGVDVLIALAGAGGGAMSGAVMSATSFEHLSLGGGLLALLLIPVLFWAGRANARTAAAPG